MQFTNIFSFLTNKIINICWINSNFNHFNFEINFLSAFANIIINHDLLGEMDEYFLSIDDSLSKSVDTRKEKFNTFFAAIDKYQDEFNDYQNEIREEYLARELQKY